MTDGAPTDASPQSKTPTRDVRVQELRFRISQLEAQPDDEFGSFTVWDWVFCILIAVAAPAVAVWIFA